MIVVCSSGIQYNHLLRLYIERAMTNKIPILLVNYTLKFF